MVQETGKLNQKKYSKRSKCTSFNAGGGLSSSPKDYGKFLDLTGDYANEIKKTEQAIKSDDINVIYEGAFEYLNTLVRTDVLIRKKNGWELLEAKASTKLKPEHIPDIAIQSYIVKKCMKELGHDLISIKLIHVNRDFILKKKEITKT